MKRAWCILVLGLFAGLAAFAGFYFLGTASERSLHHSPTPELAWLKKEFKLSDAEYARISRLHAAYLPECAAMCARVEEKNNTLKQLLRATNSVSPAIEQTLAEAAQIRVECQKMMLRHFYEVSRSMPPEQGRRYLAWMQEKTLLPTYHTAPPAPNGAPHPAHP